MVKRVLFVVGGVVIVGALFAGTGVVSYLRTSAAYLQSTAENAFSTEFQIERARGMIEKLGPEVEKNMHLIAKEQAHLAQLAKRIEKAEKRQTTDKEQIMRLQADLTSGKNVFRYAGRSYSEKQVKIDLANRFERFKTDKATLDSLQKIYDARTKGLEAAREKLEGMLAVRRQLLVEIENLEAQRQMIAAAQTTSEYQFDDSQLGRVKELISDLQIRIETERKLLDAQDYFHDQIPLDEASPEDIVDQVSVYFHPPKPEPEALARD
ncbi:MAG: hypothetical protein JW818_12670 [Pirellulales bacterium]|nr:hypothetical protein [Pirellulales bacterium]